LLQRAQLELIGLLFQPQADGERRVDLLEQRRLGMECVARIDDVVLDVAYRLQRERSVGSRRTGLVDGETGNAVLQFDRAVPISQSAL
jgi:hypothetical protein